MGIETKEKELQEFFGGAKKADWDVGLAIDAVRLASLNDVIVVVSGDGDYYPLYEYLKGHGRQVEVAAFRETTSSKIFDIIDDFINLSDDKERFLFGYAKPHPIAKGRVGRQRIPLKSLK